MKKLIYVSIVPFLLVSLYLLGPEPDRNELDPELPVVPYYGQELEEWITIREKSTAGLKDDNHARIIWFNDSAKNKTEYSVVYLHGFSASQGEGDPLHREFAKRYGANLFLSRLHDHGISNEDVFRDLSAEEYLESAKEAIAIGRKIGDKVILMSTSTGGTLSLFLAAHNPGIHALILYSPNIAINNKLAPLISGPWGENLARNVMGDYVEFPSDSKEDSLYWTKKYRIEGVVELQVLLDQTMNKKVFEAVSQPVFMGYFYKSEREQDPVVSVDAMIEMFGKLGTSDDRKRSVAFPQAGRHVIASMHKSLDWETVRDETFLFAEEILELEPIMAE